MLILQSFDQSNILSVKSNDLRNIFHKAVVVIDSDPSYGSGQGKLKTSRKDAPIQITLRNSVIWKKNSQFQI